MINVQQWHMPDPPNPPVEFPKDMCECLHLRSHHGDLDCRDGGCWRHHCNCKGFQLNPEYHKTRARYLKAQQ